MGDAFTLKLKQFQAFELPYELDLDDIKVINPSVHEEAVVDRFKTVLKEALAKSSNLNEAGKYMKQ